MSVISSSSLSQRSSTAVGKSGSNDLNNFGDVLNTELLSCLSVYCRYLIARCTIRRPEGSRVTDFLTFSNLQLRNAHSTTAKSVMPPRVLSTRCLRHNQIVRTHIEGRGTSTSFQIPWVAKSKLSVKIAITLGFQLLKKNCYSNAPRHCERLSLAWRRGILPVDEPITFHLNE